MTPAEMHLVRQSWIDIDPLRDQVSRKLYARLFELAPDTQAMFKGDMRAQGTKLMATIGLLVAHLDRPDIMLPAAQKLAVRHVVWGIRPAHYDLVGESLMWALAQTLGERFTPEVRAAWEALYALLADAMKAAAYAPG